MRNILAVNSWYTQHVIFHACNDYYHVLYVVHPEFFNTFQVYSAEELLIRVEGVYGLVG